MREEMNNTLHFTSDHVLAASAAINADIAMPKPCISVTSFRMKLKHIAQDAKNAMTFDMLKVSLSALVKILCRNVFIFSSRKKYCDKDK